MSRATERSLTFLIRQFRLAAALTQEELAERAGVSARAVSDMERGLRKSPRPETLRLLADALGLSDDERAKFFASAHPESEGSAPPDRREATSSGGKSTAIPLAIQPLPRPLDALIGRESEVEAIVSLLESDQVRLITLTGPGGVGKTRLCLAVASRLQSRFAEGVAFVDLAPYLDSDLVAPAISASLKLAVDPAMEPRASLLSALRERSVLLVLDNFEHLLGAAPLISELLIDCHSLKILATSRVRLRLRGEHIFSVQPLPVPAVIAAMDACSLQDVANNPSVRLFVDRAQEVHFGFDLNDENAAAIASVCRHLDGLPLAIELAASRVGTMSPGALQARLQQRLVSLTGGARDAPARQQTLSDAIAWSYDLLDPAEQFVLRQLAVFVGGFTVDAAVSVVGSPERDTPAAIETLAESSLLTPVDIASDEPRWTMLDTIHEYAATLLAESGEWQMVRRRHANWAIRLASNAGADLLDARNEAASYRTLDTELANLRAAIEFMLESGDGAGAIDLITGSSLYWFHRPYPRDLRRWIERALTLVRGSTTDATVLAMACLPWAISMVGDLEAGDAAADRALILAASHESPHVLGMAYYMRGSAAEFLGQVEQAVRDYEQSLVWFRAAGRISHILGAMFEVGGRRLQLGRVEEAVAILDEGVEIARLNDAETNLAYGLLHRGFAAIAQSDWQLAARCFCEGLDLSQRLGLDREILALMGGMSGVAAALGQLEVAARLQGAIEAARRSSGVGRIVEAARVEAIQRTTRNQLGSETYESLLLEGETMSYHKAIGASYRIAVGAERRSDQPAGTESP